MADYINEVQKLYVAYFSRPADKAGLDYWANVLATNPNGYQMISHEFSTSAEYKAEYGNMGNREVVNAVYQHLFGRAGEAGGLDYWTPLLDKGQITIDNVVTQIAAGARDTDLFAYNAKVAVSTSFTSHLDLANEQKAYSGDHANSLAIQYIANVKDLSSASAGMDPGAIDAVISKIVADAGLATGFSGDTAQLVGVQDAHLAPPVYG
ncbi:MAG: DUF4214 domain-containing protein [Massilia sp.]